MNQHSYRIYLPALLLLCCALYALGLDGPFLFDSKVALLRNPDFHLDPTQFSQWWLAMVSSASGPTGRPISMFSFVANFAMGGSDSAFLFKLGNLLVHCITGAVALRVLDRLLRCGVSVSMQPEIARVVAFTAVAIWMLHPLQVSTVLYSVQRMEQLSALFTLLGILTYLHFRITWLEQRATIVEISNCLLGVSLCLVLAVLSKEDGILLLPLLLLTEVIFFRFTYLGQEIRLGQLLSGGSLLAGLLLLLGLALWQPGWLVDSYAGREFSLTERLLTQARVLWQYLAWMALPDLRSMGLHHDDVVISRSLFDPVSTLWSIAAWCALVAVAFLTWRRWPVFCFALGWFLLAHLLESSLLPLEMVYEHRNYLPLLGFSLFLSWGLWVALPVPSSRYRVALGGLLLLVLCVQLGQRAALWGDEKAMATYHLSYHPDSLRSIYHFANTQLRLGEAASEPAQRLEHLELARRYYLHMHEVDSRDMTALVSLLYLDDRYFGSMESLQWMEKLLALSEKPVLSSSDNNALDLLLRCVVTGVCKLPEGEFESLMLRLSERFPDSPTYLHYLSRHAGEYLSDFSQAIAFHEQALLRSPGYLPALEGLVEWHHLNGDQGSAIEAARRMLQHDSTVVSLSHVLPRLEIPAS